MKQLLILLFLIFSLTSNSQKVPKVSIDTLKKKVLLAKEDSSRIDLYNKICWALLSKDPKIAKLYSDSTFNLLKHGYSKNNYSSFERYESLQAEAYNNLATHYYYRGDFSAAIENYLKALAIQDKYHNQDKVAGLYNNIGSMQISLKNNKDALKNFEKAKALKEAIFLRDTNNVEKRLSLAKTYNNLGSLNAIVSNYKNAFYYYGRSLTFNTLLDNKRSIALIKNNIGEIYSKTKKLKEAEKEFFESIKIFEELDDLPGKVICLNSLGLCYFEMHEPKKGIPLLLASAKICSEIDLNEDLRNCYECLGMSYKELGDYKTALKYIEKSKLISDNLLNQDLTRLSLEMTERFDSEKKEKQIALLNKDVEVQETINKKNRVLITIFIISSVLALFVFAAIVYAFLTKKKANEKLKVLNNEIHHQKELVDEKQKEILDSIHYAKRIQTTLLTGKENIDAHFTDNFIYFKPKDIVSGDFYWASTVGRSELGVRSGGTKSNYEPPTPNSELFFLAVCDSTGHGVPGAFMSLLNIGFLSEAVNEKKITSPNAIFNYVRKRLVNSISKEGQKDGFDGIIICLDTIAKKITYSAANNYPLLISGGRIKELEKDRMPVGKGENEESFKLFTVDYKPGDFLYLFTDGYADQFGGPKGKKFKYKQLNELLLSIHHLAAEEQSVIIDNTFNEWKNNLEQVDDVLLIGMRI